MPAATLDPMQLAEPRRFAQMESALNNAELFRKKTDEWDEGHGFKYHLLTAAMVFSCIWPLGLYALIFRTNPYRSVSRGLYAHYEITHDEIAKAHGLATCKELYRYATSGKLPKAWEDTPAATRPAQARRPAPECRACGLSRRVPPLRHIRPPRTPRDDGLRQAREKHE